MINSQEYIFLCEACAEIMPKLAPLIKAEYFFANMDVLRKEFKIMHEEFREFCLYPRHDMAKFEETRALLIELCAKTDVAIVIPIPNDVELEEDNWSDYRHIEILARFWYIDIEITKIINL